MVLLARAVELRVEPNGESIVVYWPTNATGFTLQIANQLPPTNGWQNFGGTVDTLGDDFTAVDGSGAFTKYFRLFKAQGDWPVLSAITVSTNRITVTNAASLQFSYYDPDGDIAGLQLVVSSQLGMSTQFFSAPHLGLDQTSGSVDLELLPVDMVYGFNSVRLQLIDNQGRLSTSGFFNLTLLGDQSGGSPPVINSFLPLETPLLRPGAVSDGISRLRAGFQLSVDDPDDNLLVARFRLFGPPQNQLIYGRDFSPKELGLSGSGGATNVFPIDITSATTPGNYTLSCQLYDRANNFTLTTNVPFTVAFSPRHPVQLQGPTPSSGRPGTIISLPVTGLDVSDTNAFSIRLDDLELTVLTNEAGQVFTEIPAGATSGRFVLETTNLVAASPFAFQVMTNLTLAPEYADLLPGDATSFMLTSHTNPPPAVTWRVGGVFGGSASNGTITSLGEYTAPVNIVSNRFVSITATLNSDTNIFGIAQVRLNQTPATPGTNLVFAANGGRVRSLRGGASLSIPAGALTSNTPISIRRLTQAEYPAPPVGQQLVSAVDLGPDGLVFGETATLRLPLNCHCPPGSTLPLRRYDPATGQYVDEGILVTVEPSGFEAVAQIPHFSIWVISTTAPAVNFGASVASWQSAVPLEEGRTVPVRVVGSGLDPLTLVTVQAVGGGSLAPGFHVDSWLGKQTNGGFVVNVPVIRDLGEGATRDFEFRFSNPSQPVETIPFTVIGLDELVVPNGVTVTHTNSTMKRWSEVYVEQGGTVRITAGVVDWQVTDTTVINGTLDASGADGANGNGITGGAAGRNGGPGTRGTDSGFLVAFDPEQPRGDGDIVVPGGRTKYPQGQGGRRGNNISGSYRITIEDWLSDCRNNPASRGCGEGISDLFDYGSITDSTRHHFADYGFDTGSLPSGWAGFSAPRHSLALVRPASGHGGGGGGGSGEVRAGFNTGGGGGAGGDGGLGVRLVSAGEIYVRGLITTDGGRGGQGVRATDGLPQAIGESRPDVLVLSAGGGGGGSAGELIAISGGGVFHRTIGGALSSRGGEPGDGGVVIYDASEARGYPTVFRGLGPPPRGGAGEQYTAGPPFTPVVLRDAVTAKSLLQLSEAQPLGLAPLEIEIHGEQPGQVRVARVVPSNNPEFDLYLFGATTIQPGAAPPYKLNLLLFPGFNTIAMRPDPRGGNHGSIANPLYELVFKRILSLPGVDTDGDGISDEDEVALGTDPNAADTDLDGSPDGEELLAGDDPTNADSDEDGVPDPVERMLGTSPRLADSDTDQVADGIEWILGFDPLSLPPGASRTCPITNGPPSGALLAQVRGKTVGARLALLDLTSGRMGTVGFPDRPLGFGLAFKPDGDLLFALGDRLVEASEAYCFVPFPNLPSSYAMNRSARTATGTSVSVVTLPGTNFVGGVSFGPQVGANSRRIDPLATDAAGDIPTEPVATFTVNGNPVGVGSISYWPGRPVPFLVGTALSAGGITGQLLVHYLPAGPTSFAGNPYDRNLKAVARFVDAAGVERIYGVAEGTPEDELVELSLNGGPNVTRVIGPLGYDHVWGLAQHPNGQLYASANTSIGFNKSANIVLVNPANAAPTVVATFPKEIFGITFAPCPAPCFGPGLVTAQWPNVRHLKAVDLDKDGYDDLAMIGAAIANGSAATLVLMRSDGLGGFQLLTNHITGGSLFDDALQIEVADLNNDTWPDLLVKKLFANPPGIVVAMNDGTGSFPAITTVVISSEPTAFDVGELTGNPAYPDLLVGIRGSIQLYSGNGDGTFTSVGAVANLVSNDEANDVRIADLNNDGLDDFVFAAFLDQHTGLNDGAGGFTPGALPFTTRSGRLDLADMNDDGNVDLVVSSFGNSLITYQGNGAGTYSAGAIHRFATSANNGFGGISDYTVVSLDRNNFPDIVVLSVVENRIHLWLNDDGNGFTTARQSPLQLDAPLAVTTGDFDGNGAPDLAVSEVVGGTPNGDHVKILLGD